MGRGKKWLGAGAVLLVILVVFLVFRFARAAGALTSIIQEVDASCQMLDAVPGPEDIVIDRERGFAFVSGTDRRLVMAGGEQAAGVRGGIYLIDLNDPVEQWALQPVTPSEPERFLPHGIGLHIAADGARSLFAVNHPADAPDQVVIFDVDEDGRLSHRRTVSDPLLHNLNDVQPVGGDAFYATNDHGDGVSATVQDFLLLDQANLVYFDGQAVEVAADGLSYANGVNVSADGTQIYVAETIDGALRIYDRDVASGTLELADYVALGTGVDNIDVQENGDLLIGAHPKVLDFAAHADDPKALSPSQVVLIELKSGGGGKARTVYLNKGDELSGLAVAAGYGDIMLLGPVFQPRILACERGDVASVP